MSITTGLQLSGVNVATDHKMLTYHRETALQGPLVSNKSGRLELGNNILRTFIDLSSTTVH